MVSYTRAVIFTLFLLATYCYADDFIIDNNRNVLAVFSSSETLKSGQVNIYLDETDKTKSIAGLNLRNTKMISAPITLPDNDFKKYRLTSDLKNYEIKVSSK